MSRSFSGLSITVCGSDATECAEGACTMTAAHWQSVCRALPAQPVASESHAVVLKPEKIPQLS